MDTNEPTIEQLETSAARDLLDTPDAENCTAYLALQKAIFMRKLNGVLNEENIGSFYEYVEAKSKERKASVRN